MKRFIRLRTWVRLIAAVVLALIVLGRAFQDRAVYGYWRLGSEPTTLYIDPELASDGYDYGGTKNWISSDFFVSQTPLTDQSGWTAVKEVQSPDWLIDAVSKGYITVSRSELGWPLPFARSEFIFEPVMDEPVIDETTPFISPAFERLIKQTGFVRVGPVPFANHPLFPGFLLLVALVYGLLLAVEQALWIPHRMRVRRHKRHGCCERCGYDLRGIDGEVCPECGVSQAESERV